MKLVEVDVVRVETAKRLLELLARALRVALGRLFGQEDILTVRPERLAELDLRLAVEIRRRAVEVIWVWLLYDDGQVAVE
jgi:hypothetical protein